MTTLPPAPPLLSTSEANIFEDPTSLLPQERPQRLDDKGLSDVYEIQNTAEKIRDGGWGRVALQFPDSMLHDAPRVFESLTKELERLPRNCTTVIKPEDAAAATMTTQERDFGPGVSTNRSSRRRLFILADTSYGACCVDEIAAEHVDADVVVHYGRSCLSLTARLPVIYVFTKRPLQHTRVIEAFENALPQRDKKVVLLADVIYSDHIPAIAERLRASGYTSIFAPSIVHDPSSPLPNRTIPPSVLSGKESLSEYSLFHISDPPPALLLTLSSRLKSMYIYPTTTNSSDIPNALEANASKSLRRRYGLITSLTTCSIFGILVNTLSVKNYLSTVTKIQAQIAAAGKKSYTFVVGKVNAAKVANFSEVGGWVVVGCWESSLIESTDFYKPIITPLELELALTSDEERVWTGEWNGDFSSAFENPSSQPTQKPDSQINGEDEELDGDESAPPEFDLRTGRYVSGSRPMRPLPAAVSTSLAGQGEGLAGTLTIRGKTGLVAINGSASPGAEYLRSQRTWKGLGSDFDVVSGEKIGSPMEEGKSGLARGYTMGEDSERK